jgi:hypothetical protein
MYGIKPVVWNQTTDLKSNYLVQWCEIQPLNLNPTAGWKSSSRFLIKVQQEINPPNQVVAI